MENIFILLSMLAYSVLGHPRQVAGQSMEPNYTNGQYLMVSAQKPEEGIYPRGEAVVYSCDGCKDGKDVELIHRIVGLPGETFHIKDGHVFINGEQLVEPYLPEDTLTTGGTKIPEGKGIIIPDTSYVVLGDNRAASMDSRSVGFVSHTRILGDIAYCYWNCN